MKKLSYILITFCIICVIGIISTLYFINSNIDNGVHKIELTQEKKSKQINATIDTEKDTIEFEGENSMSLSDQETIKSLFVDLLQNLNLEKGRYMLKLNI